MAIESHLNDEAKKSEVLNELREKHGEEALSNMTDREFYELYRA